jgi:hypothetical protein
MQEIKVRSCQVLLWEEEQVWFENAGNLRRRVQISRDLDCSPSIFIQLFLFCHVRLLQEVQCPGFLAACLVIFGNNLHVNNSFMAAPFKLVKGKEQKMIVTSSKAWHKSQPLDLFGSSLVTSNQLPQLESSAMQSGMGQFGVVVLVCHLLPKSLDLTSCLKLLMSESGIALHEVILQGIVQDGVVWIKHNLHCRP